ncbi:hypothetical protein BDC45DRAFT_590646 [Circinella umbellata]|nr:hypothetical protein BDC45DRAFT_590646 [Circinella umbellata]
MENSSEASPEIVQVHTPDDCVPSKFWSSIFSKRALSLNIPTEKTKNKSNWKKVVQKKGKRSRSSSAKTNSYELTQDMKEEYKRSFEALNDEKKWVLDDGTKVEDVMYEYGAHNVLMNITTIILIQMFLIYLKTIFTESQLQELKSTGEKKKLSATTMILVRICFLSLSKVIMDPNKGELVSGAAAATTNPSFLELNIKEQPVIDELW